MFGVTPDSVDEMFESENVFNADISPNENEDAYEAAPGSVFSFLRNSVRRLGVKFGYIKKAEPHPDVVHDFQDENLDLYQEYQCMSSDDKPILSNGLPVTVSQPQDCQKFFTQGEAGGYASVMEPPAEFILAARNIIKSNPRVSRVKSLVCCVVPPLPLRNNTNSLP